MVEEVPTIWECVKGNFKDGFINGIISTLFFFAILLMIYLFVRPTFLNK